MSVWMSYLLFTGCSWFMWVFECHVCYLRVVLWVVLCHVSHSRELFHVTSVVDVICVPDMSHVMRTCDMSHVSDLCEFFHVMSVIYVRCSVSHQALTWFVPYHVWHDVCDMTWLRTVTHSHICDTFIHMCDMTWLMTVTQLIMTS